MLNEDRFPSSDLVFIHSSGKEFRDIRDYVDNEEHLVVDASTLFHEFGAFQVLLTGRTPFPDLRVKLSVPYESGRYVSIADRHDGRDYIQEFVEHALYAHSYKPEKTIGTLSGGLDSSIVTTVAKPQFAYSGYYDGGDYYDETELAMEVAEKSGTAYYRFKVTEADFIDYVFKYINTLVLPIGGMGGVMETAVLGKALEMALPGTDTVLFGNGGDEVFMGYFWNHYLLDHAGNAIRRSMGWDCRDFPAIDAFLPDFRPTLDRMNLELLSWMILVGIHRGDNEELIYNPIVRDRFFPRSYRVSWETIIDRILEINLNVTLPTLIYINKVICDINGVRGINPLSFRKFIDTARYINVLDKTFQFGNGGTFSFKKPLRNTTIPIPDSVRENNRKRGFPIPMEKWSAVEGLIREEWESFFSTGGWKSFAKPFPGLNRRSWGIFMISRFLKRVRQAEVRF